MAYNSELILTFPRQPEESAKFNFNTAIIDTAGDVEFRMSKRSEYRYEADISDLILKRDELLALQEFYKEARGNVDSFKYKSQVEFYTAHNPDNVLSNPEDVLVVSLGQGFRLPDDTYQIIKVWRVGDGDTASNNAIFGFKTLTKIDPTTIEVFVAGVQTFDYVLDAESGIITFNTTPSVADFVGVRCEYYHEVRFNMGSLSAQRISPTEYQVNGLSLIEVVSTAKSPILKRSWESVNYEMVTNYDGTTQEDILLEVKVTELENGRSFQQVRAVNPDYNSVLGANTINEREKEFLLAWFTCCKGRLLDFEYDRFFVRFNTDTLVLSNVVNEINNGTLCERYYQNAEIPLQGKAKPTTFYETPPLSLSFEPLFFTPSAPDPTVTTSPAQEPTSPLTVNSPQVNTQITSVSVSNYSASPSIDFASIPNVPPGVRFRVVTCFWAANTVHLLLTSDDTSVYRFRLVYMRLTQPWVFEYDASNPINQIIRNSSFGTQGVLRFFRTQTGMSGFCNGEIQPIGTPATSDSVFVIRFEIADNGSTSVWSENFTTPAFSGIAASRPYSFDLERNAAIFFRSSNQLVTDYGTGLGGLRIIGGRSSTSGHPFQDNTANGSTEFGEFAPYNTISQSVANNFTRFYLQDDIAKTFLEVNITTANPQIDGITTPECRYLLRLKATAVWDSGTSPQRMVALAAVDNFQNNYIPEVFSVEREVTTSSGGLLFRIHTASISSQQLISVDGQNNFYFFGANQSLMIPKGAGYVIDLGTQITGIYPPSNSVIFETSFGMMVTAGSSTNLATNNDFRLVFLQANPAA